MNEGRLVSRDGYGLSHPFPLTGSCLSQQALNTKDSQDKKVLSHCFLGEQDW